MIHLLLVAASSTGNLDFGILFATSVSEIDPFSKITLLVPSSLERLATLFVGKVVHIISVVLFRSRLSTFLGSRPLRKLSLQKRLLDRVLDAFFGLFFLCKLFF